LTDGCAAQFKGAPAFADVADTWSEFGYWCWRVYFETAHAKGPQDAAGANLKAAISRAVLDRNGPWFNKVRNAEDFYNCAVWLEARKAYAFASDEVCVSSRHLTACTWPPALGVEGACHGTSA